MNRQQGPDNKDDDRQRQHRSSRAPVSQLAEKDRAPRAHQIDDEQKAEYPLTHIIGSCVRGYPI